MLEQDDLRCPVCRANQAPQAECRRCGADLALYIKALRSLHHARRAHAAAIRDHSPQVAAETARYLKWLSPRVMARP